MKSVEPYYKKAQTSFIMREEKTKLEQKKEVLRHLREMRTPMQHEVIGEFTKKYDSLKREQNYKRIKVSKRVNRSHDREHIPRVKNPALIRVLQQDLTELQKEK